MSLEQRTRCMSHIRARDTKPEVIVRKMLWSIGFRYRIHHGLPGKPDIVLVRYHLAIFIDGCFWHHCPLHYQAPATNAQFWEAKIVGNVRRDRKVDSILAEAGWSVFRCWEHDVKNDLGSVIHNILNSIRQDPAPVL